MRVWGESGTRAWFGLRRYQSPKHHLIHKVLHLKEKKRNHKGLLALYEQLHVSLPVARRWKWSTSQNFWDRIWLDHRLVNCCLFMLMPDPSLWYLDSEPNLIISVGSDDAIYRLCLRWCENEMDPLLWQALIEGHKASCSHFTRLGLHLHFKWISSLILKRIYLCQFSNFVCWFWSRSLALVSVTRA